MKNTSQQILNLIEAENFSELFKLKESVNSFGWGDQETQEMNFEEAIIELESITNVLLSSIKDKNNIFENFFIFQERNTLSSQLQSLNSYITNIKNGTNHVPHFIQFVQQIKQIIRNLEKEIKGYPNYQEKLKNLNYLKHRYEELIQELKEAEELKKEAEESLNLISEKNTKASEYLTSAEDSDTQISSIEKDIEERYSDIKTRDSNITDYKAEAEQNKDSILKFFERTDEYTEKMKIELNNITEFLEKGEGKLTKIITNNTQKTDEIVTNNIKLQGEIFDILGKAIGTKLYKSFNSKANWLLGQSIFWFIILVISLIIFSNTSSTIFTEIQFFLEEGKDKIDLSFLFFLRIASIFPTAYAVYFSAFEFKNTSKLKEEYDFKSSVAVALHHFKDLVKKENQDKETQNFLIEATKNIFKSPTEKVFNKRVKKDDSINLISDFKDSAVALAEKIIQKK